MRGLNCAIMGASIRHSREGGNPVSDHVLLDSRLRGNDESRFVAAESHNLGACPRMPFCHFERSVAKREILKSHGVMISKISRYRSK
jgi:hypothetical protein